MEKSLLQTHNFSVYKFHKKNHRMKPTVLNKPYWSRVNFV